MDAVDDSARVARARAGDPEAFGELITRHEGAMLAISRAYFATEADAEDAVQEAFVKAFRRLGQLDAPSRFAAWLTRITINVCLDVLRTKSDRVSLAEFATSVQVEARLGQEHLTPATLATKAEDFTGPVSFEVWIQPGENEAGRILDKLTPGVNDGFLLDAWPKLSLRLIVGPQQHDFPSVLKPGVWQHVAVVIDRRLLRVYLDGRPARGERR